MSDTSTQVPADGEGQEGGDPNLKQLREKAKRADELEASNAAKDRRIAILESGIDVESPHGELFLKGYDGEVTGEAMKAAAEKYGIPLKGQAPAATGEGEAATGDGGTGGEDTQDPTGTAERRALADGAPADTGEDEDPRQVALKVFDHAMKVDQVTEEDAGARSLSVLATAAMNGDKRVIYDPADRRRELANRLLAE